MNSIKNLFRKQDLPSQNNSAGNQKDSKKNLIPYLGIILVVFIVIVIVNFPFQSWYTGWDNLHPEFNFGLNLTRALNAVWQENQGLGTFGGHGYAATLLHTIILYLMSFIIPTQYLRAAFTFLTLIVGAIGVFFLIRNFFQKENEWLKNKAALFGGLFYMLNFATVEIFYIQLEAFIVHFALLPWLFLTLINYLENKNKKNLLLFFFMSLISTIQGFIPPLFFVYMILLCIFLFFYVINGFSISKLKDATIVFVITLTINLYWFLPVAYYSFTHSSTYLNAYNNMTSTEDFILQNRKYGNIKDLVFLKGFIIDALDTSSNGAIVSIFNNWQIHLKSPVVSSIGYVTFGIILIGYLHLIKKRKKYYYLASTIGFLSIFSLLATNTPPFSFVSSIMQKFPILNQAFRVAFTKFSIALAFFYSIGFGIGLFWILSLVRNKKIQIAVSISLATLLFYFALPTFSGNFLYNRTKINIPNIYFQMFDYFKNQDRKTRIANLPIGSHWGWSVYKWGYSGSGFLWYGIKQPIMDRAFDVWGKYNENYYWEMSQAIYSQNFQLIDSLVEKYQINWLVMDNNIVAYPNIKGYIFNENLEEYLDSSKKYELVQTFTPDNSSVFPIKVYRVNLVNPSSSFKSLTPLNSIKNIGPSYDFTDFDQVYYNFGDYYTNDKTPYDIYFLNRALFTKRQPVQKVPNSKNLPVIYDSKTDSSFYNHQPTSCGSSIYNPSGAKQTITANNILRFSSLNTENCYVIALDQLSQREGYLLKIESRHIKGKQLQFILTNHQSKRADIEVALTDQNSFQTQYIIIPPMQYYGLGYSLAFNNISIGDSETVNEIKSIKLYQYPFNALIQENIQYQVETQNSNNLFILYQSFDNDWKAYFINDKNIINKLFPFIFGEKLKNHILVNNWANGWVTENNRNIQNIIVVFWPQYLQFLGFGLLIITFVLILRFSS